MENIRPIKTEADYEWALAEVAAYFDKLPEIGSPDADRFDVLSALVEAYEREQFPIPVAGPIETITAYMQMHGLNQSAFAAVIGSRSRASEILNRRRALTMDMAYKVNRAWGIPAEILLQPYHLASSRSDAA
ncbi:XRE family transcriptional regulator [Ochrobactrum oryzae]|uniref:XRE family transcriptional regulator n=1 Tax=Brucella oryzae TaxID=335286 RepID=A0A2S7IWN5_9HYPH|nr:helix-turn-helix domain-containing protein [Brucella oryzae]NKC23022.1 XRE family transcriptional regulator [Brucella oryzae]PQA72414.1 XRE family transcriptional regulator [Brucella oryzae]